MNTTRRCLFLSIWSFLIVNPGLSQYKPFRIEIRRNRRIADLLNLDDCLTGALFQVEAFDRSDAGVRICETLELPFKSDTKDISAVKAGIYKGTVRDDGSKGWRIEIDYGLKRSFIQIHTGNYTTQIRGCILVGAAGGSCDLSGGSSKPCRDKIKNLYGQSKSRPIEIKIIEDVL